MWIFIEVKEELGSSRGENLAIMQRRISRKMVIFLKGMESREICCLGWLPFQERVEFFALVHVFNIIKCLSPSYDSWNNIPS